MQKELHRLSKQLYKVAQVTLLFILALALYQHLLKHKENGYKMAAEP